MTTPTTPAVARNPPVWFFGVDPTDLHYYHTRVIPYHLDTGYVNEDDFAEQDYLLAKKYGMVLSKRHPFPPHTPTLIYHYPSMDGFTPDYLAPSRFKLCSARLREAMALPPDVAQFLPVEIRAPDPRVHAMQYQVMRILASQPAIDLERSEVKIKEEADRHIGGTYRDVKLLGRLVLKADLQPQSDLFYADGLRLWPFATDALAERVMAAGCLGVEFWDPEEHYVGLPRTIRTARGIEKAGPKARRAHLRRVKQVRAQAALLQQP